MATIPIKDTNGNPINFTPASDCIGSPADAAAASDTGSASLISLFKRFLAAFTAFVTGSSTGSKQDTGNTSLATIAGKDFATQTTLAALSAKVPAIGQATKATSIPVSLPTDVGTLAVSIATAPVLVAGSAIIGKTGVDQTTDGTTNKVASAGLPTTAAINAASVGLATGLTVANIKASAGSV
jgi:hypothetical protein